MEIGKNIDESHLFLTSFISLPLEFSLSPFKESVTPKTSIHKLIVGLLPQVILFNLFNFIVLFNLISYIRNTIFADDHKWGF